MVVAYSRSYASMGSAAIDAEQAQGEVKSLIGGAWMNVPQSLMLELGLATGK